MGEYPKYKGGESLQVAILGPWRLETGSNREHKVKDQEQEHRTTDAVGS